jgi:hypothetical protein
MFKKMTFILMIFMSIPAFSETPFLGDDCTPEKVRHISENKMMCLRLKEIAGDRILNLHSEREKIFNKGIEIDKKINKHKEISLEQAKFFADEIFLSIEMCQIGVTNKFYQWFLSKTPLEQKMIKLILNQKQNK